MRVIVFLAPNERRVKLVVLIGEAHWRFCA